MTHQVKIEQIALYLGKPWKFSRLEPSNWRFEIIDGMGRGLALRPEKDRLKICGMFPRHKCTAYSSDYQTIGVSMARHSKDIAAEIKRRLLPNYLKSYETALLRYAEERQKDEHLRLLAESILKVSQGRIAEQNRAQKTVYFEHGEAQIWSGGDVTLNLKRLSVTQAIQIIGALNEGGS
jgi:hypothetical protein